MITTERTEAAHGGKGHIFIKRMLGEKELNGKCRLFGEITINPNCSLGSHVHTNESETYYITAGEGLYDDNGTKRMVKAGDVTFTANGMSHGIENTGDTDLVFIALIIND